MNPNKLNLGIPAYGRGFNNQNGTNPYPGLPWQQTAGGYQPTNPGSISKQEGYLNYYEITGASTGTGQHFTSVNINGTTSTTYAASAIYGCFCSFDGAGTVLNGQAIPNTVATKAQYAKTLGLGGVMVWALDADDVLGGFPVTNSAARVKGSNVATIGIPGENTYGQQNGNNFFNGTPSVGKALKGKNVKKVIQKNKK
jgi:hypothetical protein